LTGYVYDAATKLPLEGCRVGETQTDATGYFELEERRYREVALVGMEAPPLLVRETVSKAGYEVFVIEGFNPYGGGSSKGTHWKIDPIYLQRAEMQ
ncbi:MAG: hypothetical protein ACR2RL_19535, partial [Gammaproteobacteria bacterium]